MRHLKKQSKQSKAINRIFLPLAIIIAVFMLSPSSYANPEPEEIFGLGKNKKKKDPFSKKVDKKKHKPNIYSSRPLRTKSRSKLYVHSISRKKVKRLTNLFFLPANLDTILLVLNLGNLLEKKIEEDVQKNRNMNKVAVKSSLRRRLFFVLLIAVSLWYEKK